MLSKFAPKPRVTTFELGPHDLVVLVNDRAMSPLQRDYAEKQIAQALAKPGVVKALVLDSAWHINIIKRKGSNDAVST